MNEHKDSRIAVLWRQIRSIDLRDLERLWQARTDMNERDRWGLIEWIWKWCREVKLAIEGLYTALDVVQEQISYDDITESVLTVDNTDLETITDTVRGIEVPFPATVVIDENGDIVTRG